MEAKKDQSNLGIWALALGYFACYVPYSALTKAMSGGLFSGMERGFDGLELLPSTVLSSAVGMIVFLTVRGWWKHASQFQLGSLSLPRPTRWTFLSGLATAAVVATTTLAYTFEGVSIVFMMLLMRGGMLVIAPLVDAVSGRKVRWFSWVALGLSLAALLVAVMETKSYELSVVATVDVFIYLLAYFVRLRFMSRLAKSEKGSANVRFFVEEQMVATPAMVLFLAVLALWGANEAMLTVRAGFTTFLSSGYLPTAILIGLLSQGTGIFGGLILLDKRENTFTVPVNRSSSILAGVVATYSLWLLADQRAPNGTELIGAGLIIAAILVLSLPTLLAKKRAGEALAPPPRPSLGS